VEAKSLLANTNNSMKEIAFELYFEDPAYFGRFFKKHTGLTPLHFREHMRKKYHT
jgi:YesN/AraC family two-component response regulator